MAQLKVENKFLSTLTSEEKKVIDMYPLYVMKILEKFLCLQSSEQVMNSFGRKRFSDAVDNMVNNFFKLRKYKYTFIGYWFRMPGLDVTSKDDYLIIRCCSKVSKERVALTCVYKNKKEYKKVRIYFYDNKIHVRDVKEQDGELIEVQLYNGYSFLDYIDTRGSQFLHVDDLTIKCIIDCTGLTKKEVWEIVLYDEYVKKYEKATYNLIE